jgi:hypothetical protein
VRSTFAMPILSSALLRANSVRYFEEVFVQQTYIEETKELDF